MPRRIEACACVCAVSERVRGVDLSAGRVLYSTSLSGTIPKGLCQTRLRSFDIHDCGFTAFPELGSCTRLTTLDVSNNALVAPVSYTHLTLPTKRIV